MSSSITYRRSLHGECGGDLDFYNKDGDDRTFASCKKCKRDFPITTGAPTVMTNTSKPKVNEAANNS